MGATRGAVGAKTGNKGSWRRKVKKTATGANAEGEKVWAAAQRLGCHNIGDIDTASIITVGDDQAIAFDHPELAIEMRANTYVLHGEPKKKPIAEVLADMLKGINIPTSGKEGEEADDLGEEVGDVDFAKAEETPAAESQ